MSLRTPEKIRTLQKKLYLKAKAEPDYRFYLLYDKIFREDILRHAYRLAKAKGGAPCGWGDFREDRVGREGEVVGWDSGGTTREKIQSATCTAKANGGGRKQNNEK